MTMYNGPHSPHLFTTTILQAFVKDHSIANLYCPYNMRSFSRLERTWLMDLLTTLKIDGWEEFANKSHVRYIYKISE